MQFVFSDLLGDGLLLVDGENWKTQRQILTRNIFHADTFLYLVKSATVNELHRRLIPLFESASINKNTLELQDVFHRLTFDILCQVGFGHDPQYLLPSLPETPLIDSFETAIRISMTRFIYPSVLWRIKKILNIGSEKNLRYAVNVLREYVKKRIADKRSHSSGDFLDRFVKYYNNGLVHDDEDKFVIDSCINLILAGDDTVFSALIWLFWFISTHREVEKEIVKEIEEKNGDLNAMVYTHASICESMRLYPPVNVEVKQATEDDVLPDGTKVKKGTSIILHILAMGRWSELWGSNYQDFRPERWLVKDACTGNWKFVPKDPFTYPVFQAGPRTCLGKEIAFMQIKLVVACVLKRFRLVPVDGFTPIFNSSLTSKMKNGFPVQIVDRR
ncbi:cytochrome P450 94A2-like [Lycium ferocissimum]|uniref:cytochrome P450 94A2-like n=1 Tax=Lycium ferocissimum TaxID=112874 RepID=UPI0028149FAA|nr:cytochrome P450 94A2-like [Lycium ferocissimum]